jgi:O-antigen/teichoic acid export membrane protein
MKDLLFIAFSRAVIVGAQLVYVKLYANFLSNQELGLYFFLNTVSYSLNAFLFVPIDYYQQSKLYGFVRSHISLKSLVAFNKRCLIVVAAAILLLAVILGFIRSKYAVYALLAGTLSVATYIGNAMKGALNNLEHRGFIATVTAAEAILKVLLFYAFIFFLPRQATTLVSSTIAALGVALIPLFWMTTTLSAFKSGAIEHIHAKDVLKFGYPVSIGAVVNWVQVQGYRMILVPLGLAEMVGIYATVSGIGTAGTAAASAIFQQVFMPKIYKSSGTYIKTYLRDALLLIVGILVMCAVFSKLIVILLTKEEFRQFSWLLLYGVVAEGSSLLIGALSVQSTITGQTRKILVATFIGLLSFAASFGAFLVLKLVTLYTIGVPIILSQILVALYLYTVLGRAAPAPVLRHA